jgi:hypothetical protein
MMSLKKRSNHFSDAELGITNETPMKAIFNLSTLVNELLEPLRNFIGGKIVIGSAWRSVIRNREVGGVPNSQHIKGQAVDIRAYTKDGKQIQPEELAEIIRRNFKYDKLIQYLPNTPGYPKGGVHVSYVRGMNRGIFSIRNERGYQVQK